jgi:hypothetical protein
MFTGISVCLYVSISGGLSCLRESLKEYDIYLNREVGY